MPYYPKLSGRNQSRAVTDTFAGYNHNLKIRDGEFFDTLNMSLQHYPMLSNRHKRGRLSMTPAAYSATATYAAGDYCTHSSKTYRCNTAITTAEAWTAAHWTEVTSSPVNLQAIIAKDSLYWVDNGTLYANGYATGLTGLQTALPTQLVSMGAYICIFPDKKYINTMDLTDFGDMGASWSFEGSVTYSMCRADGTVYEDVATSANPPEDPDNGTVWIDDGELKEYSALTETWTSVETVYTRIQFTTMGQIPTKFKELDGVNISGAFDDELNGSKILHAVGGSAEEYDFVVVVGICSDEVVETDTVTINRSVPDMDYVCEAQNRLWGCFYGNDGTQNLNEIYCCALGDFRNWEQYLGISTDSWRASRGSDGPWTGCCNYLGTPTFFKENVIHPVTVSTVGAHQIGDIPARGVQQGSYRSLCVVNETLYYKSRTGVMAYQGGMPADVSQALGDEKYYDAVAGVFGQNYYISMKDTSNAWHLFCFDAKRGLWMHEDDLHAVMFTQTGDELLALVDNGITAINGTTGVLESDFEWSCVTGLMTYEYPDRKYLSRFNVRVNMDHNAGFKMFIEYDSSGKWVYAGDFHLPVTGTVTIPVRPRRCDHLRLKFVGHGDIRMYSIARILEKGSDM